MYFCCGLGLLKGLLFMKSDCLPSSQKHLWTLSHHS